MDYFDFEEASHAIPSVELDTPSSGFETGSVEVAEPLYTKPLPNPTAITREYGTTVKLKLINNREVEGILWDDDVHGEWPMFRAKEACELCSRMGLDCFLASRGALITGCTCCISLYRECSFTHALPPKGYITTFPGIAEDLQVCEGSMQLSRPSMKSFEESKARKTGSRFPREAVKILKKWLSEHSDHPYPNEREKEDLKQLTGLKRGQVQNWLANARRRGKVRAQSPVLGAVDIPPCKTVGDLNPLDRWKASPPENEPALMTDIARAVSEAPVANASALSSVHNSRANSGANSRANSRKDSSEDGSNWSVFRAPTVSSFETRDSSNSDFSFASSRSQQSKMSKISQASSQERRRRRRAPMTQRAIAQANKSRSARIFQCTFCTDSFPAKYDWQRHEKSLHLALERWVCCPEGGTLKVLSTGQLRCAFCPETNPTPAHLETHNFTACNEKSLQERTFYRKDHLRQHLKLMHEAKFDSAMEVWKSTTNEIKSRCGFCPSLFTTWQQRVDHLAAHYRNGSDMKTWDGNWGFEAHIDKLVENSIPPYLIAQERSTMNPFVARRAKHDSSATPGLSTGDSADEYSTGEVDQLTRDSNCWFRLEQELVNKFVAERMATGVMPTDKEIQNQARIIVYGDPDPLDWTCADNETWLTAFKIQAGIAEPPADEAVASLVCNGTRHVPIMAPYVVKGGLRNLKRGSADDTSQTGLVKTQITERTCPEVFTERSCPLSSTPAQTDFTLPPTPVEYDSSMQLDFQPDDFAALDLEDLEGLDFQDTTKGLNMNLDMMSSDVDHRNFVNGNDSHHSINTYTSVTNQHGDNGLFVPFDISTDLSTQYNNNLNRESPMRAHDLDQLSGYMAGFHTRSQF